MGLSKAKNEVRQVQHGNVEAQKVAVIEEQEDEESESSGMITSRSLTSMTVNKRTT